MYPEELTSDLFTTGGLVKLFLSYDQRANFVYVGFKVTTEFLKDITYMSKTIVKLLINLMDRKRQLRISDLKTIRTG